MSRKTAIHQLPISFKSMRLILLDLPQKEQFVSGIGVRNSREALIVAWEDQNGVIGYGECSCRPDPYYSDEFIDGAVTLIEKFIVPFLQKEQTFGDLFARLEKIRGWNFTKAAVEMAALQVIEQNTGKSPFDNMSTEPLSEVPVGISMGLFTDLEHKKKTVENALKTGYQRLKFKVSPKVRIDFFKEIAPMLLEANTIVSFDANGSLGEENMDILGYLIDTFDPMIEQPFAPNRFDHLLKAKAAYPSLFACFDEEIKSIGDLMKLHQLGVLDEVNLKVGRVGGVMKSLEIIAYCAEHHIPCWIGGMFETGIGRMLNLRMAAYLPHAKAHDLSPSDRYFLEDIIQPGVKMTEGRVDIKSLAQCKVQTSLLDKYTVNQHTFRL